MIRFQKRTNRKEIFLLVQAMLVLFMISCQKNVDLNSVASSQGEQSTSGGVTYYVDPSSSSSTQNGSLNNPWKTLTQVNNYMSHFNPGDKICFKKGQHFKGSLVIYASGTASSPIVFTTYGSGAKPVFEYDLNTSKAVDDRLIFDVANTQYIVLNGFKITDQGLSLSNHSSNARMGTGIEIGNSSHITVKNMEMSLLGKGVGIQGDYNVVHNCKFDNMRMIVNDGAPNNDFGANGIVLSGSNNEISNNYITNNWATSHDYGYDGGAIEFFGPYSNNKIMYNHCINNEGFMEFGSGSSGYASNNVVQYNLLVNNGNVSYINNSGAFNLQVKNYQFLNNNVIETTTQRNGSSYLFSTAATPSSNTLVAKNNVFWISRSVTVARSTFTSSSFTHANNIYRMASGSIGYSLTSSELNIGLSTPVFLNVSSSDPSNWNYTLASSSPAIDFGANLGITKDIQGGSVYLGHSPDAGIVETK